jgi:hypothetical protein
MQSDKLGRSRGRRREPARIAQTLKTAPAGPHQRLSSTCGPEGEVGQARAQWAKLWRSGKRSSNDSTHSLAPTTQVRGSALTAMRHCLNRWRSTHPTHLDLQLRHALLEAPRQLPGIVWVQIVHVSPKQVELRQPRPAVAAAASCSHQRRPLIAAHLAEDWAPAGASWDATLGSRAS